MHIFTLRDDKIVDDVTVLDRMALMEQLGRAKSAVETWDG
jgi:predicted ester cyclase